MTALTAPATGDLLHIVDISEAADADKNKKMTVGTLFGVPQPIGASAENTDIDTGTETVDSFADTASDGAAWIYVLKKTTNLRTGLILAAWDAAGDTVVYSETTTGDVGDTSGVSMAVDIDTNTVRLRCTVGSDDWSCKVLRIYM